MRIKKEPAKHGANSLRIIGMAQFASYGYENWISDKGSFNAVLVSAGIYVALEVLALYLLI